MKITVLKPDSAPPEVIESRILKALAKEPVMGMHYRRWPAERKRGMGRLIRKGRIEIVGDIYSLKECEHDTRE